MSHFKTLAVSAVMSAMFAFGTVANAATVTVRDNPDNGGSVFEGGLYQTVSIESDGVHRYVYAGAFGVQYGSDATGWSDLITFCLQLGETLTLPKQHEEVSGADYFANAADQNAIATLYNNFLSPSLGLSSALSAAAMQVVIWEVMEDGALAFDLSGGSFKVLSSAVLAEAQSIWSMLTMGGFEAGSVNVFSAAGTQDLITGGSVVSVPEPGVLSLLMLGALGFLGASRGRKDTF